MSTSLKCGGCKDKSWIKCCDKCLDSLFECYICKGYFKNRDYINHMNIHYNDPILYITCIMSNENQHISDLDDLDLKILNVGYVFIYIDIDIHIPKIDSRNMLKDLT